MVILDACVLIALANPDHVHYESARAIATSGQTLGVTAVTMAEYLVKPAQFGLDVVAEERRIVSGLRLTQLTEGTLAKTASWPARIASLRAETGLKMPDVIVLAAAMATDSSVATFDARLAEACNAASVVCLQHG